MVAAAALIGGAVVAVAGYAATRGPAGAVRGYFAALQRADAAAALGFGDVPSGPRSLLTPAVLREQRRVAPIVDVRIGSVRRTGSRASVPVAYSLRYPDADSRVTVHIPVHDSDSGWRLDAAAVRTRLALGSAGQRASVLGRLLPAGEVLAFPGAPPIRFDTGYLALEPGVGIVPGETGARTFTVRLAPAGSAAMQRAVLTAIRGCLAAARPSPTCPLPTERYVPGSLRGTVAGAPTNVTVVLAPTQVGTVYVTASVPVDATAYRRLDFHNRVLAGHGRVVLAVLAVVVTRTPITVSWLAR